MAVEGRMVVGRFSDCVPVKRNDGSPVMGLYEISIDAGGMYPQRVSFFNTEQDGEVTKMRAQFDALKLKAGDEVVVRFTSKATIKGEKAYVNDTALGIMALAKCGFGGVPALAVGDAKAGVAA